MGSSEYKILLKEDDEIDQEIEGVSLSPSSEKLQPRARATIWGLLVLFSVSLSLNVMWIFQTVHTRHLSISNIPAEYSGARRNMEVPFTLESSYANINRTVADEAWSKLITEPGLVALSDDWARAKNLPRSQRFPWDKSKGLYVVNGFHNLHCLHTIRKTIYQAYDDEKQSQGLEHVLHCLDVLREEVVCNADDTPRYTGRLHAQASADRPVSGIGQPRMCRDWSELVKWTAENSACYKHINTTVLEDRYKFCPNGEILWPVDNDKA